MYEVNHTDFRVIFSAIIILLFDPVHLSVLFNLLHKKHMVQLQGALILWIVAVINNAEDSKVRD